MNVTFHAAALGEYVAAVAWYEGDYPGRGERFSASVERLVAAIATGPLTFPKRFGAYAAAVPRFAYVLFFEIVDSASLRVLAVAHAKRRPGYWQRRE